MYLVPMRVVVLCRVLERIRVFCSIYISDNEKHSDYG